METDARHKRKSKATLFRHYFVYKYSHTFFRVSLTLRCTRDLTPREPMDHGDTEKDQGVVVRGEWGVLLRAITQMFEYSNIRAEAIDDRSAHV